MVVFQVIGFSKKAIAGQGSSLPLAAYDCCVCAESSHRDWEDEAPMHSRTHGRQFSGIPYFTRG